jgi:DhnA family fructose-bisphosphate aldolase class Ia
MSYLGKEVRLKRLLNSKSGKLLAITVDHAISRGIMDGLLDIKGKIDAIAQGRPDSLTMHKGIAQSCFAPHAGTVSLILKCSSFSPYHFTSDVMTADPEEGVRLGADAVSIGVIVGGDYQADQIRNLGRFTKEAEHYGMPVVAHIYPRGEQIAPDQKYHWRNIAYAVRAGAELGVDIIKTSYTGDPDSFHKVVESCPARVVIAGGDSCETPKDFLQMTKDVLDAGAAGVTYGRFVWEYPEPARLIRAIAAIMHDGANVGQALSLLD